MYMNANDTLSSCLRESSHVHIGTYLVVYILTFVVFLSKVKQLESLDRLFLIKEETLQ